MDSSKWWIEDGQYYDPDTSDVPTIDKIPAIAQYGYDTAKAISGNYVANRETNPTEIKFANGRRVFVTADGFLDTDFSEMGSPVRPQADARPMKLRAELSSWLGMHDLCLYRDGDREFSISINPELGAEIAYRINSFERPAEGGAE